MKKLPVRLSLETSQEHLSRDQLRARFSGFRWVAQDIQRDLGEDTLVQIYDDGRSSGLSFYVQLKSTRNVSSLRRKGGHLAYRIEAADLEHWEGSVPLTVIIVWDVGLRCGWWISVEEAIGEIGAREPDWREKGTVRIRLPSTNTTDDDGLHALRAVVARHALPSIARGRPFRLETTFSFPKTPEGLAKHAELQRHFATGEPVELDASYIERFAPPDWYTRAIGSSSPELVILGPVHSTASHPARLSIEATGGGSAEVSYLDLRAVRVGAERVTLSNAHQSCSARFECVFDKPNEMLNFHFEHTEPRVRVHEAREALRFLRMGALGGTFRLTFLREGRHYDLKVEPEWLPSPEPALLALVEKLCTIEEKTKCSLSIGPTWSLPDETVKLINNVFSICTTGRLGLRDGTMTVVAPRDALEEHLKILRAAEAVEFVEFGMHDPDRRFNLMGTVLSFGAVHGSAVVSAAQMIAAITEALGAAPVDETEISVDLRNAVVLEEYPAWLPPGSGNKRITTAGG